MTVNLDQKLLKAELLFSGFLVKHNLPLSTVDHATKLFRNMFPDSKKLNKYQGGRIKTTRMLTRAVPKQITSNLLLTSWYGSATDGSCYKHHKFLHHLTRHVDKDSGLIVTSLLDMPNINSGSTAQQMYDVSNEVREAFSLDWDNCATYSSDNTNSMIG